MNNIKAFLLLIVGALVFNTALAQSTLDTLRYSDWKWSLQKKAAVLHYMRLTEAEKASFWPVFESYNSATRYIELESLMLMKKYSDMQRQYSQHELENLSKRILQNDIQLAKIRRNFYKRFKDAVTSRQATAFFQIDTMFRSMMRLEAQRDLASAQMIDTNLYTRN